jgi:GntR family transcriptional regulator
MVTTPKYVIIAGEIARRIRTGELEPGAQLPSRAELAQQHDVSEIVIRNALDMLRGQRLVHRHGPGIFVTEQPQLLRLSPERQVEDAETSFTNEGGDVQVQRDVERIPAPQDIADVLDIEPGSTINHVVTRVLVNDKPASVSDTYTLDIPRATATTLQETLVFGPATDNDHAAWLDTAPGDNLVMVRQLFMAADRALMMADVTYPHDRYAGFVFQMQLPPTELNSGPLANDGPPSNTETR